MREVASQMRRGDVYWANLSPRSGSEQQGRRPVIVVSHNGFNSVQNWRSIIVVPISTSGTQAKRGLTAVSLTKGAGGLPSESVALCHQITTLDRAKLVQQLGTLNPAEIAQVESGIKYALDLK